MAVGVGAEGVGAVAVDEVVVVPAEQAQVVERGGACLGPWLSMVHVTGPGWGGAVPVAAVAVADDDGFGDGRGDATGGPPHIQGFGAGGGDHPGDVGVLGQAAGLVPGDDRPGGQHGGSAGAGFEHLQVDEDQDVGSSDPSGGYLVLVVQEVAGQAGEGPSPPLRVGDVHGQVLGFDHGGQRHVQDLGVDQIHRGLQ